MKQVVVVGFGYIGSVIGAVLTEWSFLVMSEMLCNKECK